MKYLVALVTILFISSCGQKGSQWKSVSFPLYKNCDSTLQRVVSHLGRQGTGYRFEIEKTKFSTSPKYGDIPYGVGKFKVHGDMSLLRGTTEEYLQLHISGMFSECMPNNLVLVGDSRIASELKSKVGHNNVSGILENGQFWVLTNKGEYTYPH